MSYDFGGIMSDTKVWEPSVGGVEERASVPNHEVVPDPAAFIKWNDCPLCLSEADYVSDPGQGSLTITLQKEAAYDIDFVVYSRKGLSKAKKKETYFLPINECKDTRLEVENPTKVAAMITAITSAAWSTFGAKIKTEMDIKDKELDDLHVLLTSGTPEISSKYNNYTVWPHPQYTKYYIYNSNLKTNGEEVNVQRILNKSAHGVFNVELRVKYMESKVFTHPENGEQYLSVRVVPNVKSITWVQNEEIDEMVSEIKAKEVEEKKKEVKDRNDRLEKIVSKINPNKRKRPDPVVLPVGEANAIIAGTKKSGAKKVKGGRKK